MTVPTIYHVVSNLIIIGTCGQCISQKYQLYIGLSQILSSLVHAEMVFITVPTIYQVVSNLIIIVTCRQGM